MCSAGYPCRFGESCYLTIVDCTAHQAHPHAWKGISWHYSLLSGQLPFPQDGRACSKSSKRHVQLVGTQGEVFLTLLAQPYPRALFNRLARALANAVLTSSFDWFGNYFDCQPGTFSAGLCPQIILECVGEFCQRLIRSCLVGANSSIGMCLAPAVKGADH